MIEGLRFVRGLPRHVIVPGVDVVDGSGKRIRKSRPVLLVDEPTNRLLRNMKERGIEATIVGEPNNAVFALAARDFDAVVVEAGRGMGLVKWIKDGVGVLDVPETVAGQAKNRHGRTPFFLFIDGSTEWAVIVMPPEHSYLEDGRGLQMVDAIASLDVGRLLLKGPPLA